MLEQKYSGCDPPCLLDSSDGRWGIRGVQKNSKVIYELADKLIPILWGILRSTRNFNFIGGREVLPLYSQNIQRKL